MQRKVLIDTNVYIDIFNDGAHARLQSPFEYVVFLAHPVLHELWLGAKGRREVNHLTNLQAEFVRLKRLVLPTVMTLVSIGEACHRLRSSGKLDPVRPALYNDVCIAALARQVGATLITRNIRDFTVIRTVLDFDFEEP